MGLILLQFDRIFQVVVFSSFRLNSFSALGVREAKSNHTSKRSCRHCGLHKRGLQRGNRIYLPGVLRAADASVLLEKATERRPVAGWLVEKRECNRLLLREKPGGRTRMDREDQFERIMHQSR